MTPSSRRAWSRGTRTAEFRGGPITTPATQNGGPESRAAGAGAACPAAGRPSLVPWAPAGAVSPTTAKIARTSDLRPCGLIAVPPGTARSQEEGAPASRGPEAARRLNPVTRVDAVLQEPLVEPLEVQPDAEAVERLV